MERFKSLKPEEQEEVIKKAKELGRDESSYDELADLFLKSKKGTPVFIGRAEGL